METRLLTDQDLPELQRLADACGPTAWAHSGIDPARPPVLAATPTRCLPQPGC
jgi:hypothetical protein